MGRFACAKERKLSSLSESREPRRLLDDAWGNGSTEGAVAVCLEMGQWAFAMRTVQLDYSPSVEPDFGFRYAFDQPTDMVRVAAICQDGYFTAPLLQYADERHYWYSDLETLYIRYVSNDANYGADLSLWPTSFEKLVEAWLAMEIVGNITGADSAAVEKSLVLRKRHALSIDAMAKPTAMTPPGSWSQARHGSWSRR
jgi:hypothetical protein